MNFLIKTSGGPEVQVFLTAYIIRTAIVDVPTNERNVDVPTIAQNVDADDYAC
jgi:hypothetical protein